MKNMNDATPLMQAAAKAAKVVAGWSKAKREYAARVLGEESGLPDDR